MGTQLVVVHAHNLQQTACGWRLYVMALPVTMCEVIKGGYQATHATHALCDIIQRKLTAASVALNDICIISRRRVTKNDRNHQASVAGDTITAEIVNGRRLRMLSIDVANRSTSCCIIRRRFTVTHDMTS